MRLAIFNSKSPYIYNKKVPTTKYQGFSQEPSMVANHEDGIVFRLNFDTPEQDIDYACIVTVEDIVTGQIKFGRIVIRSTDYVEVTGGHINGLNKDLVFTVQIIT